MEFKAKSKWFFFFFIFKDLSQARYGSNQNKSGKSSHGSQNDLNDSIKRPSVDDLLEELNSAQATGPVYAVPNRYVDNIFKYSVN